jgi:hypothetical protein
MISPRLPVINECDILIPRPYAIFLTFRRLGRVHQGLPSRRELAMLMDCSKTLMITVDR